MGGRKTEIAGNGEGRGSCGCASHNDDLESPDRRALLTATLAGGVALAFPAAGNAADPRMSRPQAGDVFVFAIGDKAKSVITDADLTVGGAPVLAWPMDPQTKTIRDGSRLNQLLIVRLDASSLDETTRGRATDSGIVAYSASCTHALCPVTGWRPEKHIVHCPCHNSEYDISNGAKVVFGPAPRPLPALPLKAVDGAPVAAGAFTGKVGAGTT
ncbi:Rieske 2Fe-2S domain-containing protein [Vineibacter terrae]|uniref:Rieske 2Fe-2S domain-containing protein n=2 Tax=Vineibacter terrae TaxID=2586908 RepID=A0A5C8PUK8_9HYPH|nr:Rieske 2Fe-2S domain-containing protein [Vineibacter terrae]